MPPNAPAAPRSDPNYVDEEAEAALHDPETMAKRERADALKDEGNAHLKGVFARRRR